MMTVADIEKYKYLRPEHLNRNNYTISLLNEGVRVGLIDQPAMDGVQAQIMIILADLIRKYTHGESSSLKVETTQRLLMSIFYAIDSGISSFNDPQEALNTLVADDVLAIYKKGLDCLESCLAESQALYRKIESNKLAVQIEAYYSTMNGLSEFFQSYDLLYSAQDTMANIDYPLLFDDMNIQGINYVKQYLEKLQLEDQFCRQYAAEDVKRILNNYGRVYRINYNEALINVFEIVLTNAVFSVIAGGNCSQLLISQEQFDIICQKFNGLDNIHSSKLISEAVEVLIVEWGIDQSWIEDYIRKYKSVLLTRFTNALAYECLENVIIIDREVNQQFEIIFDEGNSLDDEHFRLVVDDIIECSSAQEKTDILRSSIHSLGDFIDILEADCFFGAEFYNLFNSLGEIELSILARIVFIEEIRSNLMEFSLASPGETAMDSEWQVEYSKYLQSLDADRIESIENLIKSSLQMNDSWDYLG